MRKSAISPRNPAALGWMGVTWKIIFCFKNLFRCLFWSNASPRFLQTTLSNATLHRYNPLLIENCSSFPVFFYRIFFYPISFTFLFFLLVFFHILKFHFDFPTLWIMACRQASTCGGDLQIQTGKELSSKTNYFLR